MNVVSKAYAKKNQGICPGCPGLSGQKNATPDSAKPDLVAVCGCLSGMSGQKNATPDSAKPDLVAVCGCLSGMSGQKQNSIRMRTHPRVVGLLLFWPWELKKDRTDRTNLVKSLIAFRFFCPVNAFLPRTSPDSPDRRLC